MTTPEVSMTPLDIDGVWLLRSEEPGDGETVAIIGGIHPDEPAGIGVVNDIREMAEAGEFQLDRGNVVLMLGNLAVINSDETSEYHDSHYRDYNLNRCFIDKSDPNAHLLPPPTASEYWRSRLLLPYLTNVEGHEVEAALDLHMHYEEGVPEFIITEQDTGLATAKRIGAPVIAFGFAKTEPGGTDYYMNTRGKVGICHELGYNGPEFRGAAAVLGHESVSRFLISQGLRNDDGEHPALCDNPRFIKTEHVFKRTEEHFVFTRPEDRPSGVPFQTFQRLSAGELVAIIGKEKIYAEENQVIIFPDPAARIGDEAFTFGREITV